MKVKDGSLTYDFVLYNSLPTLFYSTGTQDIDVILGRAKSIYGALREEFIIGELERCLGEKQS